MKNTEGSGTQMSESATVKVRLMCLGQRVARDGRRAYLWGEVEGVENTPAAEYTDSSPRARLYSKVIQRGAVPGEIYTFTAPADKANSNVFSNSGEYEEAWKNRNLVLAWVAKDEAAQAQVLRAGRAKRELEGMTEQRLAPFRKAYRDEPTRAGRAAILATVIEYITKVV